MKIGLVGSYMNKKFKKEDEEVINKEIGYPYNILPRGYPRNINNEKIDETIDKLMGHLKGNAGAGPSLETDTAFINLGINEIGQRLSNRRSKLAEIFSIDRKSVV